MATKPTIPYYAPADELPAPLPTVDEILAAAETNLISPKYEKTTVVLIGEHYAVKFGRRTSVQEGMNMLFVAQSTSIPKPKVYAIFEHERHGCTGCFIVMDYIAGKTLLDLWSSLGQDKKREIATTLRAYMDELRSLPSHGYYGSPWGGPYRVHALLDGVGEPYPEQQIRGPHKTEEDFCDAMWARWVKTLESKQSHLQDPDNPTAQERFRSRWRRIYRATFKGDGTPVFTHGDFERMNVILADDGRLVMIDWEYAGWYPGFWESCHAAELLNHMDDWNEYLDEILGTDYEASYSLFAHHSYVVFVS